MAEFLAALNGDQGELDAFLETKSEAEINDLVLSLLRAERERAAKICDDAKPTDGRAWTIVQTRCKVTAFDLYDKEARALMSGQSLEVWNNGKLVSRCQYEEIENANC